MTSVEPPSGSVELAREPDFSLGRLNVSPSAGRVRLDDRAQRVEPRVMQVLVVLARAAGRTVSRDQLVDSCWDGRIVSDDAVSRVIAQVRGLSRLAKPPPFTLETVPKVGFRLSPGPEALEETAGHPQPPGGAAVASQPGARAAEAAPPASSRPPATFPRLPRLILLGLVLLALTGGGVAAWLWSRTSRPAQNGRVEVGRFTAAGKEAQDIAAAVSGALTTRLSRGGIEIAASDREAANGAAELRITGTTERAGDAFAVTSQVVDRASGLILLSRRFDRPANEAGQLADRVAGSLTATLSCALQDRKRSGPPRLSTRVFSLYLAVCDSRSENELERMLVMARQLAAAAPTIADAHAMHAIAAGILRYDAAVQNRSSPRTAALQTEGREAAARALKLDPTSAKAYVGRADSRDFTDWAGQEDDYRRALHYDPDLPEPRKHLAFLLRQTGRLSEALDLARAIEASGDPRGGGDAGVSPALMLAAAGDLSGAEEEIAQSEANWPGSTRGMNEAIATWWLPPAEALARLAALGSDKSDPKDSDCIMSYLRRLSAARGARLTGLPDVCSSFQSDWRVRLLAREGDTEGAYALLDTVLDMGEGPIQILFYPEMARVRADPRFSALAERHGLLPFWRGAGRRPDFCRHAGAPEVCRALPETGTVGRR